jgi:MSHA biogenesis protein MshL
MHDFDYEIRGARVVIKPAGLRSAVYQVNYLTGNRLGSSSTRVSSGSIAGTASSGGKSAAAGAGSGAGGEAGAERGQVNTEVRTQSASDFWADLRTALEQLVGAGQNGRGVVISPQSGVVVVRAMQRELAEVERFLQATRLAVGRQVILEAKIVEVQLNGEFQSGVNWAAFARSPNVSLGFGAPGAVLGARGSGNLSGGPLGGQPGSSLSIASGALDSMFGIAVQTSNFAALISFLETQGTVHVLSSPRISTMNNQKAVLKVGTEEFFVTDLKPGTVIAGSPPVSTPPSVTLQPFFSGVVLDVTPQIDDQGNVMLHVRPSVSEVTTVEKAVNLGDTGGQMLLPLASSSASETDSIIRARDGQLVVIGGLMRQAASGDRGQLPGLGDVPLIGALFRNTEHLTRKRELVILLRPIVIDSDRDWNEDLQRSSERLRELAPPQRRTGLQ